MNTEELKVVLLGKVAVGKTWLVERYMNDRCTFESATIGAAFSSKHLEINGKTIKLCIWDTAGAERFEAMAKTYYRGAGAAIVCYDVTDASSLDKAKFWIKELRQNVEDCIIYLCGTKKDIVDEAPDRQQVNLDEVQTYAQEISANLLETSSRTGENVKYLFQKIAEDYVINSRKSKIIKAEEVVSLTNSTSGNSSRKRMKKLLCC